MIQRRIKPRHHEKNQTKCQTVIGRPATANAVCSMHAEKQKKKKNTTNQKDQDMSAHHVNPARLMQASPTVTPVNPVQHRHAHIAHLVNPQPINHQ